jgi:AraC-like DNA-binding protein
MARLLSVDAICDLIDSLLLGGYPPIEQVARLLCVSPRSLQRALSGADNSYSNMVDRCRRKAACESLEQTKKPIREIAKTLGYRDASSFSRAFRRWTGTMPRAYRNQLIASQGTRSCQNGG